MAAYEEALRLDPALTEAAEALHEAEREWADDRPVDWRPEPDVVAGWTVVDTSTPDTADDAFAYESALRSDDGDVPADLYLSAPARLLRGWPGHRTRPGRSGYDYVDTAAEEGYMLGLIVRQLFAGTLPLETPLSRLLALVIGAAALLPLPACLYAAVNGEPAYICLAGYLALFWVPGAALIWNVMRSFESKADAGEPA
jgi:hypothetical protein